MAKDELRSDPVFGKLRRMKGLDHVILDEQRKVVVPKAGNRWRKLADIMGSVAWDVCEAFDASGAVLGVVENPAEDDERDDAPTDAPVTLRDLARVLVDVQRATMSETRLMFQAQMDGNARIIEGMAEANRTIADSYALALKVSTAATASTLGAEGGAEVGEMMKMAAMMMMQRPQAPAAGPVLRQQAPAPVRRPPPPRVVDVKPVEVKPDGGA